MAPFQIRRSDLAKLDVLETKFNMYEDLSRQMIDRLEQAVEKISDSNNKIASILTKHDERIEQNIKNDEYLTKQIDELKQENKEDHNKVIKRIEKLEQKMDDFVKFRWMAVGVAIVLTLFLSQASNVVSILTPDPTSVRIEKEK
jgi:ElaB/YqjD/DUF883 family membrane-anchored ribosome-binding protein